VELRDVIPADDGELARGLLRVQHAAYAVEAALIGDDRIPPLHEGLDDLRSAPLLWLAAFTGGALVGAVAWTGFACAGAEEVIPGLWISRYVHPS
jgi:hypothetical protein